MKGRILFPEHPLGNNIEFQRLSVLSQRFGFILAREWQGYVKNRAISLLIFIIGGYSYPIEDTVLVQIYSDAQGSI